MTLAAHTAVAVLIFLGVFSVLSLVADPWLETRDPRENDRHMGAITVAAVAAASIYALHSSA